MRAQGAKLYTFRGGVVVAVRAHKKRARAHGRHYSLFSACHFSRHGGRKNLSQFVSEWEIDRFFEEVNHSIISFRIISVPY